MLSLLCLLVMNMQCNEDDNVVVPCGLEVVVDAVAYQAAESHAIDSAIINDDCLALIVSGSGCDASTWLMSLIDSGNVAESFPNQRYLKLTLHNNEDCLAVFNKEENFDLTALRIEGANEVLLNIEGLEESILYSY